MDKKAFYFEKPVGTILCVLYVPMTAGFAYAATLDSGQPTLYTALMIVATLLCVAAIAYLLRKWVYPAYKHEPAVELDEHGLYLSAHKLHIAWTEIESIACKSGEYSNVIGIKIRDIDSFLHTRGMENKKWMYRAKYSFYKHHIGIAVITIKASATELDRTINEFYLRYGLL